MPPIWSAIKAASCDDTLAALSLHDVAAERFALSDVRLTGGPFRAAQNTNVRYLLARGAVDKRFEQGRVGWREH